MEFTLWKLETPWSRNVLARPHTLEFAENEAYRLSERPAPVPREGPRSPRPVSSVKEGQR